MPEELLSESVESVEDLLTEDAQMRQWAREDASMTKRAPHPSSAEHRAIAASIEANLAKIEALKKEITDLSLDIYKSKRIVSPIRRTPPEILSIIFSELGPFVYPRDAVGVLNLTRVCKYWRSAAVGTPALWSSVMVGFDQTESTLKPAARTMERWVRNAANVPLSVTIYSQRAIPVPVCNFIKKNVNRVGHLHTRALSGPQLDLVYEILLGGASIQSISTQTLPPRYLSSQPKGLHPSAKLKCITSAHDDFNLEARDLEQLVLNYDTVWDAPAPNLAERIHQNYPNISRLEINIKQKDGEDHWEPTELQAGSFKLSSLQTLILPQSTQLSLAIVSGSPRSLQRLVVPAGIFVEPKNDLPPLPRLIYLEIYFVSSKTVNKLQHERVVKAFDGLSALKELVLHSFRPSCVLAWSIIACVAKEEAGLRLSCPFLTSIRLSISNKNFKWRSLTQSIVDARAFKSTQPSNTSVRPRVTIIGTDIEIGRIWKYERTGHVTTGTQESIYGKEEEYLLWPQFVRFLITGFGGVTLTNLGLS